MLTGEKINHTHDKLPDNQLTNHKLDHNLIIDENGYDLAESTTLRLKGGGETNSPDFSTPLTTGKKRKQETDNEQSTSSDRSEGAFSKRIDDHFEKIEQSVSDTRKIIEYMIKEAKVGRRWAEC